MKDFARALSTTLILTALVLFLVLAFVFINGELAKSGFSSGEVLALNFYKTKISGEFMGEKFYFGTEPFFAVLGALRPLFVFLPPPVKFVIRLLAGIV